MVCVNIHWHADQRIINRQRFGGVDHDIINLAASRVAVGLHRLKCVLVGEVRVVCEYKLTISSSCFADACIHKGVV